MECETEKTPKLQYKHYVVAGEIDDPENPGKKKLKLIASRTTRRAAQDIADRYPGAYVQKMNSKK